MGDQSTTSDPPAGGDAYRCVGSLTIARAASTQRELTAAPDPLTIDLSGVERMDTVGAWVIYRTVRDRGAKVVGANKTVAALLDQVAEADRPARIRPDGDTVKVVHATDAAPSEFDLGSISSPTRLPGDEVYVECAAPFAGDVVLMGRRGGPEFLDSELARLEHLLGLAITISRD